MGLNQRCITFVVKFTVSLRQRTCLGPFTIRSQELSDLVFIIDENVVIAGLLGEAQYALVSERYLKEFMLHLIL